MHASYLESSFYNMYYRNSTINDPKAGNKKLRFANENSSNMNNNNNLDQDESNFGLEVPTLELADS